jgi:hypothetical protein
MAKSSFRAIVFDGLLLLIGAVTGLALGNTPLVWALLGLGVAGILFGAGIRLHGQRNAISHTTPNSNPPDQPKS